MPLLVEFAVLAATEDPRLTVLADDDLLRVATGDRRALVTQNAKDFDRIVRTWASTGEHHAGVVFTSPSRFNRAQSSYPADLVAALGRLLSEPADERAWVHWLS